MDEALQSSCSLPPFLSKTYEMVDDSSCDSIVSWSSSNESFVVLNLPEFERVLLPRFFKHSNFSSFNRQLNTYGFRKIDPEQWEFANENFIKGQPHLLKNIHRRKPVHSHSLQNFSAQATSPLPESERRSYKKDIEGLKQNKERLLLELQRHEKDRERFDLEIQLLNEKFKRLQEHQNNLVAFLARVLQNPSLDLNLVSQFEFHDRKRRLPRTNFYEDEISDEDNQMGNRLNLDGFELLETSLASLENVVLDVRQTSNIDLDESTIFSESQSISKTPLYVSDGSKSPALNMNSEPLAVISSSPNASNEHPTLPTGVNDIFWEQFLTENPGSSDSQEVQSERKDSDLKEGETKAKDHGKFWWNTRTVNNLTELIGRRTTVEKTQSLAACHSQRSFLCNNTKA